MADFIVWSKIELQESTQHHSNISITQNQLTMKNSRYIKVFEVAIVAIMTIGSVALVSCDKESQNPLCNESSPIAVKTQNNPISNPNNPYDYLGLLHNEVLDTVLMNRSGDSLLENAHKKNRGYCGI